MNNLKELVFKIDIENSTSIPDKNTPICLNKEGNVTSYFNDDVWDFSDYAQIYTHQSKIDFTIPEDSTLTSNHIYHIKLVLFYIIFSRRRKDNNITISTIQNSFFILRKLATICSNNNCNFISMKKNILLLNNLKKNLKDLSWDTQKRYITHLNYINKTGSLYKILNFGFEPEYINRLKIQQDESKKPYKQTLLIPSKIYK